MPPSSAGAAAAAEPPLLVLLVALGSSGDVHPFIGLGRELRRRGHAVTVAAAEWFRDVVERSGLAFVDPLPEIDFVTAIDDPALWRPLRGTRLVLDVFARPLLEPVWRLVTETLAADRAVGRRTVVAASTLALGARVARETHPFPLVTVHLSPGLLRGGEPGPRIPGLLVHRGPVWFRALQWELADRLLIDRAIGTLAQGFAAGVPQLVMPMGFDQFDNAARLVRLGAGAELPRRAFRGPRLAAALGPLLDDAAVAAGAAEIAARLRAEDGVARAADEVEAAAAGFTMPVAGGPGRGEGAVVGVR